MATAGEKVVATAPSSDKQATAGNTTSTSYTATLSAGTAAGVAFVAPPSGSVWIDHSCAGFNSTSAAYVMATIRVRTGGTIGSGVDVLAAGDDDAWYHSSVSSGDQRGGVRARVSGLTPGSTYNAQQLYRVLTGGTGTFNRRQVHVTPIP